MSIPRQEHRRQFASNISRFFVYTALKGFGFGLFTAIWVIYLQQRRGLSLTQATLIDVAFWIAATLGEVPTGIVADTFGRRTSLAAGAALLCVSSVAWALAPTMPLIMLAYVALAIGTTFLSGAEDAFLYESLQRMERAGDYARLVGRVSAAMLGATALGNMASGLLATIDLIVPFLVAGLSLLITLGIVLTFKEPQTKEYSGGQARQGYGQILRQSIAMMRAHPSLRYPMLYLTLVPLAAVIMETFFLQPQTLALGVPIVALGVIVMAMQMTNMAGATWSNWITARVGEGRVVYTAPVFIVCSLIMLAALQLVPALVFIAVISFVTAVLRPLLLSRIQHEVSDAIRATILSMQSLMATFLLALSEPILGFIADRSGLPTAYIGLAGGLSILILFLFWKSRHYFPLSAMPTRTHGDVT
jgi:MFS family permease